MIDLVGYRSICYWPNLQVFKEQRWRAAEASYHPSLDPVSSPRRRAARRLVVKAEQLEGKENPRYVVTNLGAEQWPAQKLYEDLYCARGEMENRIKEQLSLFAARVSAETMRAKQLRLYFAAAAYVLLHGLRRLGLRGTQLERAQATTIRLRLLKIGAQIRITARKVWLSLASSFPLQPLFAQVWAALRC
jgi:Transposase DDE domain group 1